MSSNEQSNKQSNEQSNEQSNTTNPSTRGQKSHIFHNPFSHSHKYDNIEGETSKDAVYNPPYIQHPSHKPHSNASAPASDAAERGKSISEADSASFAQLMQKTKGMTPEETKAYLASLPRNDQGAKIMLGEQGYMQVTGAFGGTM